MTSSETQIESEPASAGEVNTDAASVAATEVVAAEAAAVEPAADADTDDEPETAAAPVAAAAPVTARVLPKARALPGTSGLAPWMLAVAVIPPGWFYILRVARWHLTSSTVMLMICWAAIVGTGFWAIRMALAASAEGDEGWFSVRGRREELEREKRGLLKAIKDIEFDHETGKLSAADAAALTASYRARAIEVIKTIEAEAAAGTATSVRDEILAEVRARAAIDAKVKPKAAKAKSKKEKAA